MNGVLKLPTKLKNVLPGAWHATFEDFPHANVLFIKKCATTNSKLLPISQQKANYK
jgi:hypothetical protein